MIKRTVFPLLIALGALCLSSCDVWSPFVDTVERKAPERVLEQVSVYDAEKYLIPIWNSQEVYDETVVFVGEQSYCNLIYAPTEIVSVRDRSLQTTYVEGVDYRVEGNRIYRLAGSSMPYFTLEEYFCDGTGGCSHMYHVGIVDPGRFRQDGITYGTLAFVSEAWYGNPSPMMANTICVTYRHDSANAISVPADQSAALESVFSKLRAKEDVKFLVYGDSVAVGCSSSSLFGLAPNTPTWPQMIEDFIESEFEDDNMEFVNNAVGGWTTTDGLENYNTKVKGQGADVLILAFGLNDSTRDALLYVERPARAICSKFLQENPDGVVVLVSGMPPSTLFYPSSSPYYRQDAVLAKVAAEDERIIFASVGSVFKDMMALGMESKDYLANNANHCNDFATRIYAQVILKTMFGNLYWTEEWV